MLSSRQFWDLMQHWAVSDEVALQLIQFPGKLGADGKRPRFRFTTRQQRITSYLPEIDAALAGSGVGPGWLHRKIRTSPFSGRTPIEHIVALGLDGLSDVMQVLNRAVMKQALAR